MERYALENAVRRVDACFCSELAAASGHEAAFKRARSECLAAIYKEMSDVEQITWAEFVGKKPVTSRMSEEEFKNALLRIYGYFNPCASKPCAAVEEFDRAKEECLEMLSLHTFRNVESLSAEEFFATNAWRLKDATRRLDPSKPLLSYDERLST